MKFKIQQNNLNVYENQHQASKTTMIHIPLYATLAEVYYAEETLHSVNSAIVLFLY